LDGKDGRQRNGAGDLLEDGTYYILYSDPGNPAIDAGVVQGKTATATCPIEPRARLRINNQSCSNRQYVVFGDTLQARDSASLRRQLAATERS
jgi:hypothetical protein